ncbi:MAG: ribbon-helix-helix protein, CopG family, partial [Solirubrobacteraceae bacterium]
RSVDGVVYGVPMADVTQIAFQLDNDSLREVDALAAAESASRAEVLRTAVHAMLRRHREAAIDEQLEAGYGADPPGPEVDEWAQSSIDGLRAAELDW